MDTVPGRSLRDGLSPSVEPASSLAGSAASIPSATLDQKGRCCGRKPIEYKRPHRFFCGRCDRQFSPTGDQEPNWAYRWVGTGFFPTYPDQEPFRTILASAIEARRAETRSGSVADESAVPQADAHTPPGEPS